MKEFMKGWGCLVKIDICECNGDYEFVDSYNF